MTTDSVLVCVLALLFALSICGVCFFCKDTNQSAYGPRMAEVLSHLCAAAAGAFGMAGLIILLFVMAGSIR